MSRPATTSGRRRTTALRIEPELHDRLRAAAQERDVSVNLLINRAIERLLDQLPSVDETIGGGA